MFWHSSALFLDLNPATVPHSWVLNRGRMLLAAVIWNHSSTTNSLQRFLDFGSVGKATTELMKQNNSQLKSQTLQIKPFQFWLRWDRLADRILQCNIEHCMRIGQVETHYRTNRPMTVALNSVLKDSTPKQRNRTIVLKCNDFHLISET